MKYVLSLVLTFILLVPVSALAQIVPNQPSVELVASPQVPEPYGSVTITARDYTLDNTGATISWFVDGVEQTDSRNLRTLTITAKGISDSTVVGVRMTLRTGLSLAEQITIKPAQLDIVLEGETVTPSFYKGRPLMTVGSRARAVAIPDLGDGRRPEDFTYVWKHNNTVLYGGPVTGRNYAAFTVGLDRTQFLSVDVIDRSGSVVAKKSVGIPLVEPELYFYPLNPLRGVSTRALTSPFPLIADEVSVRAEPYYMSADIFARNPLLEWQINGQTIATDQQNPLELTLRRNSSERGAAAVSFHIRNLEQLIQGVEESFQITY